MLCALSQDVVSSGYVPYGAYVRDYIPPSFGVASGNPSGQIDRDSPIYGTMPNNSSALNVADPRFSATYGNAFLKQVRPTWVPSHVTVMHAFYVLLSDRPRQHAVFHVPVSSSSPSRPEHNDGHTSTSNLDLLSEQRTDAKRWRRCIGRTIQNQHDGEERRIATADATNVQTHVQQLSDRERPCFHAIQLRFQRCLPGGGRGQQQRCR